MADGREVPPLSDEPRLVVAEQDEDVAGPAAAGEVAVIVDVVRREERRGLGHREGAILGELDGRDCTVTAPDPPAAMRLEAGDRADRDPRAVVVDGAHLALVAVDERETRPPVRRVDRERPAPPTESLDPAGEVIRV